jgi:acyl-CoA synthetase (AMP-forming)/AMP-acid ligase II
MGRYVTDVVLLEFSTENSKPRRPRRIEEHLPEMVRNDISNIVEALRHWFLVRPDKTACIFLKDGDTHEVAITFEQLYSRANALAHVLLGELRPGDRAILMYPPGNDFTVAFFGCLLAQVIAVPVYPPRKANFTRIEEIAGNCEAVALLTANSLLDVVPENAASALGRLKVIATDNDFPARELIALNHIGPDDIAFLQYTSGSTGQQKGVCVSHGNIWHNQSVIYSCFEHGPDSTLVGWLPVQHDMGLIGNLLQPIYLGTCSVLLPPTSFIQRPIRWLRAISRYRPYTSGAPNFAYELCARSIRDEDCDGLDLSSWRVAFNGAEPVQSEVMDAFAARFAKYGFDRNSLYPCYGLAEATLMVTGSHVGQSYESHEVDAEQFALGSLAKSHRDSRRSHNLVISGEPPAGIDLKIVDPVTGEPLGSNRIGEVWVSGPSVAKGYWGMKELTASTFGAKLPGTPTPYLRTGDLGALVDGALMVVGRVKDLLIVNGRKYHASDIEKAAQQSSRSLVVNGGSAFTVIDQGSERIILVQEIHRAAMRTADFDDLMTTIRQAVASAHENSPAGIVLTRPGSSPKTLNGKLRRSEAKRAFLAGDLDGIVAIDAGARRLQGVSSRSTKSHPLP